MLYCLKLSLCTLKLNLVFHVVKLTSAPKDLVSKRCSSPSLNLIIIDRKEEQEVEKILGSYWHHKRY